MSSAGMAGNICSETGGFHETINHEVFIAESEFRIYADCNNCEKDLICVIPFSGITSNVVRKDYDMRTMKQEELLAEIKELEAHRYEKRTFDHPGTLIKKQTWRLTYNDFLQKNWDISKSEMIEFLRLSKDLGETIFYERTLLSKEEEESADKCSHMPLPGWEDTDFEDGISFEGNCKNCEYIIHFSGGYSGDEDFFDVLDQYHL